MKNASLIKAAGNLGGLVGKSVKKSNPTSWFVAAAVLRYIGGPAWMTKWCAIIGGVILVMTPVLICFLLFAGAYLDWLGSRKGRKLT